MILQDYKTVQKTITLKKLLFLNYVKNKVQSIKNKKAL